MGNEFEEFLKAFGAHTTLITQADNLLLQLGQYSDEYNKTGKISKESVDDMREKFFEFVKGVTSLVYGSEIGKIIKKAKGTIKSGVEFLQSFKEYTDGDAKADEMIDAACGFIGNISKYYPVIGPVIGPLFDKAARIYFNAVKEESELIQGYEELIEHYLDEYDANSYYQDYITALGNDEEPDTTPADTTPADTTPADIVDNSVTITGTDGDDKIDNSKDNAIIHALGGDDSIYNYYSSSVIIDGGEGKDTINNWYGSYATINGGNADDSICNSSGNNVSISGGDGNDTIKNGACYDTINGGSGNDSISSWNGSNISINGGDGKDTIYINSCDKVTITGDDDDDHIEIRSSIFYKTNCVTIDGGNGNDSIYNDGDSVTIDGGNGDDYIVNGNNTVAVDGGKDNDTIRNHGYNVTIDGSDGDDSIFNWASSVTINGGDGDDSIYNHFGNSVIIDAGFGNDYVTVNPNSTALIEYKSGDGFDTVAGFNGDDTLSISGGDYSTQESGNDVLVVVDDGSILLKNMKGQPLNIIRTQKPADTTPADTTPADTTPADTTPADTTPADTTPADTTPADTTPADTTPADTTPADTTPADTTPADTTPADTTPADTTPADTTPADTTPADTTPADTTPADTTPADTTPADTMLTVTNTDKSPVTINSAIEVVDASTRTKAVKITGNALDNTITGGSGKDTLDGNSGDDVLTGGGGNDVFVYGAGNDIITDYGNGSDKVSLTAAAKSFGYVGNDFVFDFDNGSLTLTDAASKKISVVGSATKIFTTEGIYNSAGTAVTVNALATEFTADSKIVTIDAGLTSGATITGNSKANKVSLGNGENIFIWANGGNDTLYNFGDDDLVSIAGAVSDGSISGGNVYLKIGTKKITVKDSSQVTFTDDDGTKIFDGGIFYDADKTSATLASSTKNFTATDNVTNITGNAKANKLLTPNSSLQTTLTGGRGNDTFVTAGGNNFITDYGTGSDKISLNSSIESFSVTGTDVALEFATGSVTIANGAGKKISLMSGGKTTANIFTDGGIVNTAGTAVTLSASAETFTADSKIVTIDAGLTSNATITGNSKANKIYFGDENIFIWANGGNDTLYNFGDDDLISIAGSVSDGSSISSGNVYLKIGTKKITVKDSSQVTFTDDDGTKIFDGGIFYDADKTCATLGSSIKNFTATDNVTDITGNSKANKIISNTTGATLTGGKGNDSLWGGDGSDTFHYDKGDGKDIIFGFDADDLLEIDGLGDKVAGTFNAAGTELTVKVGSTTVALLKDFGSTTTFNITANGTAHQIIK